MNGALNSIRAGNSSKVKTLPGFGGFVVPKADPVT
jgi:hypothetical protein